MKKDIGSRVGNVEAQWATLNRKDLEIFADEAIKVIKAALGKHIPDASVIEAVSSDIASGLLESIPSRFK